MRVISRCFGGCALVGALACGAANDEGLGMGTQGGSGSEQGGGAATGGTSGAGTGGGSTPALAGTCAEASVRFAQTQVYEESPLTHRWGPMNGGGSFEARVLGLGTGLPPEDVSTILPPGIESAEQLGWLRLAAVVEDGVVPDDAGLPPPDAAAGDAGARVAPPGAPEPEAPAPPVDPSPRVGALWAVLGPRELGAMDGAAGETVAVHFDQPLTPSYYAPSGSVALSIGARVVLLHHVRDIATSPIDTVGFRVQRAEPVCQVEDDCYRQYRHAVDVTVPGGAEAHLLPGESQRVGGYRVLHGNTGSRTTVPGVTVIDQNNRCADRWVSPNQLTAIAVAGDD